MTVLDPAASFETRFALAPTDQVVSIGGDFSRHLGPYLRSRGHAYLTTETAHPILPPAVAEACQYGVYSARYGEVPTVRHLRQLLLRATGQFVPAEDVWRDGDRYVDPFRPAVQPGGFATLAEYRADRQQHFAALLRALTSMDVFFFTIDAIDCWVSRVDGAAFPIRPGDAGGVFDAASHARIELTVEAIVDDMAAAVAELRKLKPNVRIALTVAGRLVSGGEAHRVLQDAIRILVREDHVTYLPAGELLRARAEDSSVERSDSSFAEAVWQVADRLLDTSEVLAPAAAPIEDFRSQVESALADICDDRLPTGTFKCLVWDADETIWHGTLLEGDSVLPKPGVIETLKVLDGRGILHSIASRGDQAATSAKLDELGLGRYFVYPQITWESKAASIRRIAKHLGFGFDAIAFVDDQAFERDAVRFELPDVTCFDAAEAPSFANLPAFSPRVITAESGLRRAFYAAEQSRSHAEETFAGSPLDFLATLNLEVTISPAGAGDLQRAEELALRTQQFNSTGRLYSHDQLDRIRVSDRHLLLVAGMTDRYGPYGTVGLCIVTLDPYVWTITLILMSCRVLARGVTGVLLGYVVNLAAAAGVRIRAEFVPTARNRPMLDTFSEAGFLPREEQAGHPIMLERATSRYWTFPPHVRLHVPRRPAVR
ncbi:MAG TPA: GSCFA domain-containing protein [Vicinamibacterales bacterium]|nr:GSCFA domain-containing protein [Vicinamibacterales bacterium]